MGTIPGLRIKNFALRHAIIQGGMGAGVSGQELVTAVSLHGGLGVLSSAGMRDAVSLERHQPYTTYEAVREEIEVAMADRLPIGLNVMCRLEESYDETIRAALDAQVSALFIGAGLPRRILDPGQTALIPIVSSARALKIILRFWRPDRPNAVVLEGPRAGGHLGFHLEDIENPDFSLENLLPEVLDLASKNGNFPVIVAGGIYTHEDIDRYLWMGASGVQLGTRFLATKESRAIPGFKQAVVDSTEDDIIVIGSSPCGFPFRILKGSPAYQEMLAVARKPKCRMGYVLSKDEQGHYTVCKAHPNNPEHDQYFCICDALRAAIGLAPNEAPMYTVGSNAWRVKRILSVAELMTELVYGFERK